MRRIWRHKLLVIAGSAIIFVSIGTVAWATTSGQTATGGATTVAAADTTASTLGSNSTATLRGQIAQAKQALKQKRDQFLKQQEALMQHLRADMTPADQALYDQLVATAKQQRDAVRQACDKLKSTLKQLRDLRNKYLDATTSSTSN